MFKLRYGYLISGILIGCILLFSFATFATRTENSILFFVTSGKGTGHSLNFRDGRDMIVDGGPDNSILTCLSNYLPFWQRHIDIVLMTHPQADHFFGLISVFQRYSVSYFLRSDVPNETASYDELMAAVKANRAQVEYMTRGMRMSVGQTHFMFLWPSVAQIAKGKAAQTLAAAIGDLNAYCQVFELQYGSFSALFTGDADAPVEPNYTGDAIIR